MKKFNIAISAMSIITTITASILAHCGIISSIDGIFYVIATATALVFLLAYCLKDWVKSLIIALAAFLIVVGVGKASMMIGNIAVYTYVQSHNLIEISKIKNSDTHQHLMSYQDKEYYVDENFEYLYCIDDNGLFSTIEANSIMIAKDTEEIFDGYLSDFYIVNNNNAFQLYGTTALSIGFLQNAQDESVFLKMIDKDNKVYYSYITGLDTRTLVQDLELIDYELTLGDTTIIFTKPSKIINGTLTGDEAEYETGSIYAMTFTKGIFVSQALTVQFTESNVDYTARIPAYVYREYNSTIALYEQELAKMDPSTEDYKALAQQIDSLKASMTDLNSELCYETVFPDKTIRLYVTYSADEEITEVPNINIIEVEFQSIYVYAYTYLTPDDVK
jgi:hypothetical protein